MLAPSSSIPCTGAGFEVLVPLDRRGPPAFRPSVLCPPYTRFLTFDCANVAATFCLAASCNSSLRVSRGFTKQTSLYPDNTWLKFLQKCYRTICKLLALGLQSFSDG